MKNYVIDVLVTKKYVHIVEAKSAVEAQAKVKIEYARTHDKDIYEIKTEVVEEHD